MKKYLAILLTVLWASQIDAQQITNTFPDTIFSNEALNVQVRSFVDDNGPPPTFCSPLVKVEDTIIGNQVIYDLTFDLTGVGTPNGCVRIDTLKYRPIPQGNYQFICYWSVVDSTGSPPFSSNRYSSDTLNFHVRNVTSLKEFNPIKFKLYPNPTKNILQIENLNNTDIDQIEIWDIKGAKIRNASIENMQIDVSDLKNGTYFLRFIGSKINHQQKILKL